MLCWPVEADRFLRRLVSRRPLFPISQNLCLMSSSRSCEGTAHSTLAAIVRGEGWTASSVRNTLLRKNYRRLGRAFCRSNPVTDSLRESCLRLCSAVVDCSDLLATKHPLNRHLVSAVIRVAAYSDRWIRDPEDWEPCGGDLWRDLLRHLFVKWEMPVFFDSAWLTKGSLRHLERDWFCDVAVGMNWRKLDDAPKSLTSRAVHLGLQAPDDLTVRQAMRWGQLGAMGARPDLVDEVLESCVVNNLSNDEIWSRLFDKVAREDEFDGRDFGLVADVFDGIYRAYQFNRARDLVGLPMRELLNHCWQYWRRLLADALADGLKFRTHDIREAGLRRDLAHFTNAYWEPMEGVDDQKIEHRARNGQVTKWEVNELTRHSQLVAEGLAMNHCVGGYRRDCQRNEAAIFSVEQVMMEDGCHRVERRVTVEVYRKKRMVVQVKRRWNDDPEKVEFEVIEKWAGRNGLVLRQ